MTSLENLYTGEPAEAQHMLNNFWTMITDEIKNVQSVSYACYITKYITHFEVFDHLSDYQSLMYFCVVVFFHCPYAQSISCGEDINVETDECRYFLVVNIDFETQCTVKDVGHIFVSYASHQHIIPHRGNHNTTM